LISVRLKVLGTSGLRADKRVDASMLFHGRQGCGKTTFVKTLAERMERDQDWPCCALFPFPSRSALNSWYRRCVDTLYKDLRKCKELRPVQLKHQLEEWIDEVAWHKPGILILDGLDVVAAPEVEVRFFTRPISTAR
jgi:hypothetical protein